MTDPRKAATITTRPDSRLIGVIDCRLGRAVHAVAGNRSRYRVIDQLGCRGGDVTQLAASYVTPPTAAGATAGCCPSVGGGLYVADLDAIIDASDGNQEIIDRLVETQSTQSSLPLPLWIDRGGLFSARRNGDTVLPGSASLQIHWILGTESIRSETDLVRFRDQAREAGVEPVVSLDLSRGRLISPCPELAPLAAVDAAAWLADHGFRSMIVLDLASVGVSRGPSTAGLCRAIADRCAAIAGFCLVSGGGVRDSDDVDYLVDAGCRHVLVATWIQRLWRANSENPPA
jgi:phosphoribosylformimino-5-aminoimidazole carboxamide ribotide isomerase